VAHGPALRGLHAGFRRAASTITDITFIYAEGLAISEPSKQASLEKARKEIDRLEEREPIAA
jgi:hypothetical protein